MLIDMFFSLVSTIINGLVTTFIPNVNLSFPTGELTWLVPGFNAAGQLFPISTWFAMLGIIIPLRFGYLLWQIAVFVYNKIPVLGHSSL